MTVPFVEFTTLAARLTAPQRALVRVAFDRQSPSELPPDERAAASKIFGPVEAFDPEVARVLALVKGRGIGFSVLAGELLAYRAATLPLKTDPAELVFCFGVGPRRRHAETLIRFARTCARRRKLRVEKADDNREGFTIRRSDGRAVRVEALAASRAGDNLRGFSIATAVLDEAAFLLDADYVANGEAIFAAIMPRLLAGGQVVLGSSPWLESGVLYTEFSRNFGNPVTALAAHCPTPLMRDDAETLREVARAYERDPENATRELGAEFLAAGTGTFFDPEAIRAAILPTQLVTEPRAGAVVACGADFGFVSDSSALVIVQVIDGVYHVSFVDERKPSRGSPLKPSEVVAQFAHGIKTYGCQHVASDQHYQHAIAEFMGAHKLGLIPLPEGRAAKEASYVRTRQLLAEGRLRLPMHPRLIRQLREVMSRPAQGGGMIITSPRSTGGGHGDLVSALVAAVTTVGALGRARPRARLICIRRNDGGHFVR